MRKDQRERLQAVMARWGNDRLRRALSAVRRGVEKWAPQGKMADWNRICHECALCKMFYRDSAGYSGCRSRVCPLAVLQGMSCDGGNLTVWSNWRQATLRGDWPMAAALSRMMLRDLRALKRALVTELKKRQK